MTLASLAGRRVLVVGGASGIGRATVLAAVQAGARVGVIDRDADGAAAVASAAGAVAYPADITVESQVAAAVNAAAARLGGLDAVLHVAGIMRGQQVDVRDLPVEVWSQVIAANLTGAFLVAKHTAGPLIESGAGVLVFVASRAGVVAGSGSVPYGASKGGLHGLALTLARQLGPSGVRVHTLCPGDIDTPLMRESLAEARANGADENRIAAIRNGLGSPEQVARALVLLASPAAEGLVGTVYTD